MMPAELRPAGALNVTRRGPATATRPEIEKLAAHVTIEPFHRAGVSETTALHTEVDS